MIDTLNKSNAVFPLNLMATPEISDSVVRSYESSPDNAPFSYEVRNVVDGVENAVQNAYSWLTHLGNTNPNASDGTDPNQAQTSNAYLFNNGTNWERAANPDLYDADKNHNHEDCHCPSFIPSSLNRYVCSSCNHSESSHH